MRYSSQVFAVIALIIVVILIVLYIYYYEAGENIHLNYLKGDLEISDDIFETSELNPYKVPFFENKEGPFEMKKNEAILIYGTIPKGYMYWSIAGYLYSVKDEHPILSPVGDVISSAENKFISPGDSIAVVFTSNYNMYEEIALRFREEKDIKNLKIKIIPLIIDDFDKLINPKYTIIFSTALRNKYEKVPDFKCRYYTSDNIKESFVSGIKNEEVKEEGVNYSEKDLVSEDIWNVKSVEMVKREGHKIVREVGIHNEEVAVKCFNKDAAYIISDEIKLKDNEFIVVVAVNHFSSKICLFSNITFYNSKNVFYTHVTGDSTSKKFIYPDKKIFTHVIIPKNLDTSLPVRIEEKIFIDYKSKKNPYVKNILPMKIFICQRS